MPAHATLRQSPHQHPLHDSRSPHYYIPIPTRLIRDMGRNQLAVGLYALIGRLWRTQADADGWVTLSDRDIMLFDPTLNRGVIRRAFTKLITTGWVRTQDSGYKRRFSPSWGLVKGTIQPWCATAPNLGRPAHVKTVRLDQQLLDAYIGRLTLRPTEPVIIDRYVAPMLSLADVGAYASTLAGYPQPTDTLRRLGLVVDDGVVAIPALATILGQAAEVTQRGIQRLGWAPISAPQPPPAPDQRPAVFFVAATMAATMIRTMTGTMAAWHQQTNTQRIPQKRDETPVATAMPHMTWKAWSTWTSWINPPRAVAGLMGGLLQKKNEQLKQEINETQHPEREKRRRHSDRPGPEIDIKTEAEQALLSAGVWSRTAKTLREAPLTAVQYALEQAQAARARDVPAYAVELLKSLKERQWQLPPVPTAETFDIARYTTGEYANFIRDAGVVVPEPPTPQGPDAGIPAAWTVQALWQAVQAELRGLMTPAVYQATIAQAELVQLNGAVVILAAPTVAVRDAITEQCVAPLKQSLSRLLAVPMVKLVIQLGVPAARPVKVSPAPVAPVSRMGEERPAAATSARQPAAEPVPVQAIEVLPETLAELLPALQQQLRHRAAQRQQRELALLASVIQCVTVQRDAGEDIIELTPAVPTNLWRPEDGDQVVLTVGQSSYLEELVKANRELLAEELGGLVDRRLCAADIVVRQSARGRPGRQSGRT